MTWRIAVEHRTRYRYAEPVWSSYNEARLTPLTTHVQLVLDADVTVVPPHPTVPLPRLLGHGGSRLRPAGPHSELVVTAHSLVETAAAATPTPTVGCDELASARVLDDHAELLAPTAMVPSDPRLADVAGGLRHDRDPQSTARAAVDWVRDQLTYVTGSTGVHTSAVQA